MKPVKPIGINVGGGSVAGINGGIAGALKRDLERVADGCKSSFRYPNV